MFVDENGIVTFTDENGVSIFIDENGIILGGRQFAIHFV
jgi:hypothetical protein